MQHIPVPSLGLLKLKVQAGAGVHLTREEVIAALLSPSIKWMGEFDEVGNAQKFAFTEICTTPKNLPSCQLKSAHCPCLLSYAPPLFPPSTNCRQQLQPEDCCRLCSHWIACQRGNVDFNPHNISCAALDCLDRAPFLDATAVWYYCRLQSTDNSIIGQLQPTYILCLQLRM